MEYIIELLKSLTIFNWMAIIAFIFLPLSALNAFLGLKSRYNEWKPARNKKNFEKRVKEFSLRFNKIIRWRSSMMDLFIELLDDAMPIAMSLLAAFFLFFVSFYFYVALSDSGSWLRFSVSVLVFTSIILLNVATTLTAKLSRGCLRSYLSTL